MAAQCNPRALATVGAAGFAVHVALVALFWPIPPVHNGYSVPLYLLGNLSVLAVAGAVWWAGPAPWRTDRAAAAVDAIGTVGWRLAVAAGIGVVVTAALALRLVAPDTYYAFWREEGVFEPLTLLCYAASAGLLWRAAPGAGRSGGVAASGGRPWRLAAIGFVVLALEEVDYFGIFGGLIGRIDGEYAGSLHDIVRLASLGLVGAVAWAVIGAVALAGGFLLWRAGWLDFGWIGRRLTEPAATWLALAAAFLAAAMIEESYLFGVRFAQPTPEEAIELGGGLALAAWAVESAAGLARPGDDRT